jgi:hypothetical protein
LLAILARSIFLCSESGERIGNKDTGGGAKAVVVQV